MGEWISNSISWVNGMVWGPPLVALLLGGGVYLMIVSRFVPFLGFFHAIKLLMGRVKHKGDDHAEGQISHFQALSNALAATVGLGNIAGVAIAIYKGGPGAVFWMWVTALLGMNTKFFECSLAVMFRGKDYRGEVQGGPMYVIQKTFSGPWKWLATAFACFGLLGCMAMFQANQFASFLHDEYRVDRWIVGIGSAIVIGYVLMGGIRRLAQVTSSLVPSMCLVYVLCCLTILAMNLGEIPATFGLIFEGAFGLQAMTWGALMQLFNIMMTGVKRAAFSNEAGVGTAPMAHGNARTSEPISEGLVAMLGPFLDTIVVCTMTALVILIAVPAGQIFGDNQGVLITKLAFEKNFGEIGVHFLGIAVFLFAFTTMLGMANYNEKCWNFLFQGRKGLGEKTWVLVFCATLVIGATTQDVDDILNILDTGYGLMAFPNMIACIVLAPRVREAMKKYFQEYT